MSKSGAASRGRDQRWEQREAAETLPPPVDPSSSASGWFHGPSQSPIGAAAPASPLLDAQELELARAAETLPPPPSMMPGEPTGASSVAEKRPRSPKSGVIPRHRQ